VTVQPSAPSYKTNPVLSVSFAGLATIRASKMNRCKTFIVEDSPVIADNLVATLEELTSVVVVGTAPDEASAVQWLNANQGGYGLVIIDIFLAQGSGLEVLRAAVKLDGSPTLAVLTNYATPLMRQKCFSLGAARVFDKSTELEELVEFCANLGGQP
jgi:DNA-binding NarL/FixJ family response regulator